LVEELPVSRQGAGRDLGKQAIPKRDELGILCVAWSLMPQTAAQVEYMRQAGCPVFELDSRQMFDQGERAGVIGKLSGEICRKLKCGEDVVLHTSSDPKVLAETKTLGKELNLSSIALSRLVSDGVAEVALRCVRDLALSRLLIAGGDTAAAICSRLEIQGMRVWQEIEPGIASCISLTEHPLFLILKPGGFGGPDFFAKAAAHLRGQE
jgi:uncharacterized protein YgbK (DUF1537 family)